jgi:hypothetical protein
MNGGASRVLTLCVLAATIIITYMIIIIIIIIIACVQVLEDRSRWEASPHSALSDAERLQAVAAFRASDVDRSGCLSFEETRAMFAAVCRQNPDLGGHAVLSSFKRAFDAFGASGCGLPSPSLSPPSPLPPPLHRCLHCGWY